MRRILLPCLLALLVATASEIALAPRPGQAGEPDVESLDDVVYGTGGGEDLRLDLARPAHAAHPVPAVLVFHGGGWVRGAKAEMRPLVRLLAERGYFAATVAYRLSRPGPGNPHPWPDQIEDAKCAVRWLRATSARWNVDPGRIAAVGFSAGAHLAMLLGTMDAADGLEGHGGHPQASSKVNAVVAFYGPTDMGVRPPRDPAAIPGLSLDEKKRVLRGLALSAVLGPEFGRDPTRASPLRYVDHGDAPMLLFQGTKDHLVEPFHARLMVDALTRAGVPGRAVFMVGLGHGWRREPYVSSNLRESLQFLAEQFRPETVHSLLPELTRK
jgi:acetyl esterase/lipase